VYNRFHRGEWITWVSGGEGALDTPGPLNGTSECCGSGMFTLYTGSDFIHPGSRFDKIPDLHQRIINPRN
jgi:hypothetical protein